MLYALEELSGRRSPDFACEIGRSGACHDTVSVSVLAQTGAPSGPLVANVGADPVAGLAVAQNGQRVCVSPEKSPFLSVCVTHPYRPK